MATLKDVANLAGVSIATVSNYLNNTKPVSKEISKKIQDAVNELHYSINQNAKNLKSKTNTDIGVILPSLNDSYYVQLFQGIKSYFQNTNYYLNLDFSENIPESEKNIVHNLKIFWTIFLANIDIDYNHLITTNHLSLLFFPSIYIFK